LPPDVTTEAGPRPTIALALSGGGFRATLFHLGVIWYLRSTNHLGRLSHVASVSGGSILAAHLATNWSAYTGSPEDFRRAAQELIDFTAQDVRGRIVRRLPWLMLRRLLPQRLPIPKSTTDLFILQLRRFYRERNLADIASLEPTAPRFSFVATNLTHPGITTFENDRVVTYPLSGEKPVIQKGAGVPIHLAVACSAAYPAFFAPLAVSHDDLMVGDKFGMQYFTDGGVIDNQGLQAILDDQESAIHLIISDASSSEVESQPRARFGIFTSGLRAMELMMAKIRRGHYTSISNEASRKAVVIDIDPEANDLDRDGRAAVVSQLPRIRTDLDEFDEVERQELIHHGYFSAQEALHWPESEPPPTPGAMLPAEAARHLRSRFRLRLRLFSMKDYATLVNLAVIFAGLALIGSKAPQFYSTVSQSIAVISSQDLLKRHLRPAPETPPLPIERVDDIGRPPVNPGFRVTGDQRVWDLRALKFDKNIVVGSAFVTKYTDLVRQDPKADRYEFWYETSGTLRVWLIGRDTRLSMTIKGPREGTPPSIINGAATLYGYKGIVDCRQIGINEPFVIVTLSEYSDSFKTRGNWWAGMKILDPLDRAAMRVVFPASMPFHNPSFRRYPNSSRLESTTFDGTVLDVGRHEHELLWTVSHPVRESTYSVFWDW
jgi:predicted acylesterase/phospholipase RssA